MSGLSLKVAEARVVKKPVVDGKNRTKKTYRTYTRRGAALCLD
jgi:hypothetical protein